MKDRRRAGRESVAVDPRLRATRRSHVDARLRADARGCDGGFRQELAAAVAAMRMRELRPLAGNETQRAGQARDQRQRLLDPSGTAITDNAADRGTEVVAADGELVRAEIIIARARNRAG